MTSDSLPHRLPMRADVARYAGVSEPERASLEAGIDPDAGRHPVRHQQPALRRVRAPDRAGGVGPWSCGADGEPARRHRQGAAAARRPDESAGGGAACGEHPLPAGWHRQGAAVRVRGIPASVRIRPAGPSSFMVAFDGTKEAEFCWPPLTASRQPLRDMAIDAVNSVLAPDPGPPSHRSYPMEPIIGQSCGCSSSQWTDNVGS